MALLFELADYSLHQLKTVPEELACTSKERRWGVPGQRSLSKEPVMTTAVKTVVIEGALPAHSMIQD